MNTKLDVTLLSVYMGSWHVDHVLMKRKEIMMNDKYTTVMSDPRKEKQMTKPECFQIGAPDTCCKECPWLEDCDPFDEYAMLQEAILMSEESLRNMEKLYSDLKDETILRHYKKRKSTLEYIISVLRKRLESLVPARKRART